MNATDTFYPSLINTARELITRYGESQNFVRRHLSVDDPGYRDVSMPVVIIPKSENSAGSYFVNDTEMLGYAFVGYSFYDASVDYIPLTNDVITTDFGDYTIGRVTQYSPKMNKSNIILFVLGLDG